MDENEQLLVDIEARESRLNSWEHDFIANIRTWIDAKRTLTKGQEEKLAQIWEKVTEKG